MPVTEPRHRKRGAAGEALLVGALLLIPPPHPTSTSALNTVIAVTERIDLAD
jgi:hypothetical protein